MKAFVIAIVLLVSSDVALNHSNNTRRVFQGVAGFLIAVGDSFGDSVFSR